jgi:hypothetical protein
MVRESASHVSGQWGDSCFRRHEITTVVTKRLDHLKAHAIDFEARAFIRRA